MLREPWSWGGSFVYSGGEIEPWNCGVDPTPGPLGEEPPATPPSSWPTSPWAASVAAVLLLTAAAAAWRRSRAA
jgi:hypothetical protein